MLTKRNHQIIFAVHTNTNMGQNTRRCLEICGELKHYYTVNKDSIDPAKTISSLLPVIGEMIDMYNREFENSIAYLQLHDEEKAKKRVNLEICCTFIYDAIRRYSQEQQNLKYLDFKDYSAERLSAYSDEDLRDRLSVFVEVVTPMLPHLIPYGVTNSRIKALSFHLANFLPALPVHVTEIEQRKNGYQSAMNCLASIEGYLAL
jgi:hypothetical protein